MTAPEIRDAAIELVERTTAEQGLPVKVEDQSTIARVVALVRGGR